MDPPMTGSEPQISLAYVFFANRLEAIPSPANPARTGPEAWRRDPLMGYKQNRYPRIDPIVQPAAQAATNDTDAPAKKAGRQALISAVG